MTDMTALLTWPTLIVALAVFGVAPGVVLRLIVLLYRRDNPRRQELLGELYGVPRIERPFWVAEQLEVAFFEGLRDRFRAWLAKWLADRTAELAAEHARKLDLAGERAFMLELGVHEREAQLRAREARLRGQEARRIAREHVARRPPDDARLRQPEMPPNGDHGPDAS